MAYNTYIPTNTTYRAKKHEESLQIRVANYMKKNYPGVIFVASADGIYKTPAQATLWKAMNSEHKRPDMFILERSSDGQYTAMCIELKAEGVRVRKKNGDWIASEHVRAQAECHELLRKQGYWAGFCVGYDEAVGAIDEYMGVVNTELMF